MKLVVFIEKIKEIFYIYYMGEIIKKFENFSDENHNEYNDNVTVYQSTEYEKFLTLIQDWQNSNYKKVQWVFVTYGIKFWNMYVEEGSEFVTIEHDDTIIGCVVKNGVVKHAYDHKDRPFDKAKATELIFRD